MAALTDAGLVTPETEVNVPASVISGGRRIGDAFDHGAIRLTANGIVSNSSNVGTVLLARTIDKAKLRDYLTSFGLGSPTGLGLPGEASGMVPAADMTDQTRDQIAFGQGLSATAIQMAAAVGAVVNDGIYVQPSIVASATDESGQPVAVDEPTTKRVISSQASAMVREMMEAVVTGPSGINRFPIAGYHMGAKSGTAEAIDPTCGCYNGYVASFVGVAPISDPEILTYVMLDHPVGQIQGSEVAAPVVKDIMRIALPRYGVPIETDPAPKHRVTW
jgi:cell division protein FtsI (penicillin-binding protein 3)